MAVAILTPVATTAEFVAEMTVEPKILRHFRPTAPTKALFNANLTTLERRRTVYPKGATVNFIGEPAIFGKVQVLNPKAVIASFDGKCTQFVRTNPPNPPVGAVMLSDGEALPGKRLRAGDFHRLKLFARGERIEGEFQFVFRAASLSPVEGKTLLIEKATYSTGILDPIFGIDSETGEETINANLFFFATETTKISKETEFTFEFEADDLCGYRKILQTGNFTFYPDNPP